MTGFVCYFGQNFACLIAEAYDPLSPTYTIQQDGNSVLYWHCVGRRAGRYVDLHVGTRGAT